VQVIAMAEEDSDDDPGDGSDAGTPSARDKDHEPGAAAIIVAADEEAGHRADDHPRYDNHHGLQTTFHERFPCLEGSHRRALGCLGWSLAAEEEADQREHDEAEDTQVEGNNSRRFASYRLLSSVRTHLESLIAAMLSVRPILETGADDAGAPAPCHEGLAPGNSSSAHMCRVRGWCQATTAVL
jgi:hypothetical protein